MSTDSTVSYAVQQFFLNGGTEAVIARVANGGAASSTSAPFPPLAFEATDGKPVDVLFALAVPEECGEDHLKLLAHIAELFSQPGFVEAVRSAETPAALLKLLSGAGQ